MNERLRSLEQAGPLLTIPLDERDQERILAAVRQRVRQRQRVRRAALAAALVLMGLGAGLALSGLGREAPRAEAPLRFADGSAAHPSATAQLEVESTSEDRIRVRLRHGSARFEVTPNPARPFEVITRDVTVRVLGTVFTVEERGEQVHVSVEEGRVRVISARGELDLRPGERAAVPASAAAGRDDASPELGGDGADVLDHRVVEAPSIQGAERAPRPELTTPERTTPAPIKHAQTTHELTKPKAREVKRHPPERAEDTWRALADRGDYHEASKLLWPAPKLAHVEELMLAADTMRLAGKPQDALPYLERVSSTYGHDPRAPLAEFTRGRLLLDKLGRPAEAAEVFARLYTNHPKSAIAEHAMAREVEAWSKAGERARAQAAAKRYMERYPQGPRRQSVRLHGELP